MKLLWKPNKSDIKKTNLYHTMQENGFDEYNDFHAWSSSSYDEFTRHMVETLKIPFKKPFKKVSDISKGIENIAWFPESTLNIADACFHHHDLSKTAIIYEETDGTVTEASYADLNALSNKVANSILAQGLNPGDRIAICMPFHPILVTLFLGIIKAGCCAVPLVESFAPNVIAERLEITNTKLVFTQDSMNRNGKSIPLLEKIREATNIPIVFLSFKEQPNVPSENCISYANFLATSSTVFNSHPSTPDAPTTILFSSGTTGTPKAIPWDHTTPIRSALNAYLHHDIKPADVFCWPTSFGWMMGPWVLYATLINGATLALYEDIPMSTAFGKFIQQHKITILGTVPTITRNWIETQCMEGLDWSAIKCFTSTGECSNEDDYTYLSKLAGGKPIIEYCGGTEIGGAYISSTLIQPNYASAFSTPTCGINLRILDEQGQESSSGEVAITPPAIGLSRTLLNADHHNVYFEGMPSIDDIPLRRHGDEITKLDNGYYQLLGRHDDTMNIGGIKISSIEIERILNSITGIHETAAVSYSKQGPQKLYIFTVLQASTTISEEKLKTSFYKEIKLKLNPLFKIEKVIIVNELPRTTSNKIMRKELRKQLG